MLFAATDTCAATNTGACGPFTPLASASTAVYKLTSC